MVLYLKSFKQKIWKINSPCNFFSFSLSFRRSNDFWFLFYASCCQSKFRAWIFSSSLGLRTPWKIIYAAWFHGMVSFTDHFPRDSLSVCSKFFVLSLSSCRKSELRMFVEAGFFFFFSFSSCSAQQPQAAGRPRLKVCVLWRFFLMRR